jgi:hypothetical protein
MAHCPFPARCSRCAANCAKAMNGRDLEFAEIQQFHYPKRLAARCRERCSGEWLAKGLQRCSWENGRVCGTPPERPSCWRLPSCQDAAPHPPERSGAGFWSGSRLQQARRQLPQRRVQESCILRCIRNIAVSLGTLDQGLDLDDLCSFPGSGAPAYLCPVHQSNILDSRYAVQTDACNSQTYAPFDAMGPGEGQSAGAVILGGPAEPISSVSSRALLIAVRSSKLRARSWLIPGEIGRGSRTAGSAGLGTGHQRGCQVAKRGQGRGRQLLERSRYSRAVG